MKRSFSASTSLVRKIFTNYSSTFGAFCELINNSIQANAKNVWIDIDYVDEQYLKENDMQLTISFNGKARFHCGYVSHDTQPRQ